MLHVQPRFFHLDLIIPKSQPAKGSKSQVKRGKCFELQGKKYANYFAIQWKLQVAYRIVGNHIWFETIALHLIKQLDAGVKLSILDQATKNGVTYVDTDFGCLVWNALVYF